MKQKLPLTRTQSKLLSDIRDARTSPQRLVFRACLLLDYAATSNVSAVATKYATTREAVQRWRDRWQEAADDLASLEDGYQAGTITLHRYRRELERLLADVSRPGHPATITEDQKAQILALAAEEPETAGVPLTHWTCTTLQAAVIAKGIVPTISRSRIGAFLKQRHAPAAP